MVRNILTVISLAFALLLAGCGEMTTRQQLDTAAVLAADPTNLSAPRPGVYASGQPTEAQLRAMAAAGIQHVVNLRPDSELTFDEAALVNSLGMTYHQIPVAGIPGVTLENAKALDELLSELGDQGTLVHCSSSNRVGGLIAIAAHELHGKSVDEALAEGQRWGLTGLAPVVRETLQSP